MVNAISKALGRANIPVVKSSDDLAEILQMAGEQVEYKKKEAPETASGSQRNHQPTAISSADGANILKNIGKLIKIYNEKSSQSKTFIGDVADALNIPNRGRSSRYGLFETMNGKCISLRLSNHNATISNFDDNNENEGISIVINFEKNNKGISKGGNAHIIEFYYDSIKLRKAYGQPLVEILQSLKEALLTGEYKDTTGLAQREEVNARFLKDKSGTIYGWTSNGKIYLTKNGLNPKTMIHEYTHLWSNAMMYGNPKGWQSVKDIMRQDPLWRDVKDDSNYADIADDEDMVVSEVLSRRSEQNNSVLLERQAQKVLREDSQDMDYQANQLLFKMKEALNTFWDWVTTKLFNMKRFQSMEQVSNRVLYDLVNSTPLEQTEPKHGQPQYSILKEMEYRVEGSLKNKIIDLDDPSILEKNPFDDNIITSPTVIKHGSGLGVRCKVNGIQRSAEPLSTTEEQKYNRLLQSGNVDELKKYTVHLAEIHFGSQTEEEQQNRGFKR